MKFCDIIPGLEEGKRARRFAWSFLKDGYIQKGVGGKIDSRGYYSHVVDVDDILYDDWEIMDEGDEK